MEQSTVDVKIAVKAEEGETQNVDVQNCIGENITEENTNSGKSVISFPPENKSNECLIYSKDLTEEKDSNKVKEKLEVRDKIEKEVKVEKEEIENDDEDDDDDEEEKEEELQHQKEEDEDEVESQVRKELEKKVNEELQEGVKENANDEKKLKINEDRKVDEEIGTEENDITGKKAQTKEEKLSETIQDIILDIDLNIEKEEQLATTITGSSGVDIIDDKSDLYSNTYSEKISKVEKNNESLTNVSIDVEKPIRDERIDDLKQQEYELLKRHEELSSQIKEQKLLAEKLREENERQKKLLSQVSADYNTCTPQPQDDFSQNKMVENQKQQKDVDNKEEIFEKNKIYNFKNQSIDLKKIFTPATDNAENLPKNRNIFASSAFYSPQLHPTVEDQLELARKISNSLRDTSNETSKGQSMYVNRMKRSNKWVHTGIEEEQRENDENNLVPAKNITTKNLLRLVMNPRGQVIDYKMAGENLNIKTGLLSPENCKELTNALHMQIGKGAELFAKRRKKVDKWIKEQYNSNSQRTSGITDFQDNSDFAQNQETDSNLKRNVYSIVTKPKKTNEFPFEGQPKSNNNFQESLNKYISKEHTPYEKITVEEHKNTKLRSECNNSQTQCLYEPLQQPPRHQIKTISDNSQRKLAYLPSVPKGWNAPSVSLPSELYLPPEIPLECYAPPPTTTFQRKFVSDFSSVPFERQSNFESREFPIQPPFLHRNNHSTTKPKYNHNAHLKTSFTSTVSPMENRQACQRNIENSSRSKQLCMRPPYIHENSNSCVQYHNIKATAAPVLNNSNFNNSARGWNAHNFNMRSGSSLKTQADNLPYSDF